MIYSFIGLYFQYGLSKNHRDEFSAPGEPKRRAIMEQLVLKEVALASETKEAASDIIEFSLNNFVQSSNGCINFKNTGAAL